MMDALSSSPQVPRIRCVSESETIAAGRRLGAVLRTGDIVSLHGPLGAGKTVLVRGIASGCGADARLVKSPTFVLHHIYRGGRIPVHHIDLYRLGPGCDATFLDLETLLLGGAVVVEWGELGDLSRYEPADVFIHIKEEGPLKEEGPREVVLEPRTRNHLGVAWTAQALTDSRRP